MLGLQDLGHRVVVRRIIGHRPDGRPLFSDALGTLITLEADAVTVETANGPMRVRRDEIAAGKRVPDRRGPTAREIAALERVAAAAWPAPDTADLGTWLLRAADGWTGRANSALAVGDPGMSLPAAIDAVTAWYTERNLPPRITVPLPLASAVDRALELRGWSRSPAVLVQTAPLTALLGAGQPDGPPVHLTERPSDAWLDMVAGRKGALPAVARHVLAGGAEVRFPTVYDADGRLLAVARGVRDGEWLGLFLVEVAAAARRQGLARHVMAALAQWAVRAGASRAYLQVEEHNEAAVGLYAGLGFTTHHRYVYRDAP